MNASTTPPRLDRDPSFRRFWSAHAAAQLGEQISLLALPLAAAVTLAATPLEMGWLSAAQSAPYLLIALFAGVWVDRNRRRPIMVASDLSRAAMLAAIPLAASFDRLSIAGLTAVGFAVAVAAVLFDVAAQSYLPTIARRDQLGPANARLELTRSVALVGGPGIAGLLMQALAPAQAIVATALAYLVSALLLGAIRAPEARPAAGGEIPMGRAIADGIAFVAAHRVLRAITLTALLWNLSWFVLMAAFVLVATRVLGFTPAELGLVFAAQGAGMLIGAALAQPIAARTGLGRSLVIGPAISALACPLFALAPPGVAGVACCAAGLFLFGFGPAIWAVNQMTLRQAVTPNALLGRVNATIRFASWGARPLGALLGGWIGESVGLQAVLWVAAAGYALQILPVLLSPIPRLGVGADLGPGAKAPLRA